MPRFVVLHHETPKGHPRGSHYDLMLEFDAALRTWALAELPADGRTLIAERLSDHRLAYLDYEGVVAGGRGCVSRIDEGEYELIEDTATGMTVRLQGIKLQGTLTLVRTSGEDSADGDRRATLPQRWRISLSGD